jgi:hypothetical protein
MTPGTPLLPCQCCDGRGGWGGASRINPATGRTARWHNKCRACDGKGSVSADLPVVRCELSWDGREWHGKAIAPDGRVLRSARDRCKGFAKKYLGWCDDRPQSSYRIALQSAYRVEFVDVPATEIRRPVESKRVYTARPYRMPGCFGIG